MNWNPDELAQGAVIASHLAECVVSRAVTPPQSLCLSVAEAGKLVQGLNWPSSGLLPEGKVAVRQICRLLGFDEHFPFRWRLEHKLVQAHVLNHFCPGCMPVTCGLRLSLAAVPVAGHADAVRMMLSEKAVLKRSLGFGTRPEAVSGCEQLVDTAIAESDRSVACLADEDWVVQERIPITEEYRVHSLEDSVIEDLTFTRHLGRPVKAERSGPNDYVRGILDSLPNACVANSICGWDIAKAGEQGFRVIEVNFGGVHPVSHAGYQVSGFFQDRSWGPAVVARLVRFIEEKYCAEVQFCYGGEDTCNLRGWYRSIELWSELFRISRRLVKLSAAVNGRSDIETWSADLHRVLVPIAQRLKATIDLVE